MKQRAASRAGRIHQTVTNSSKIKITPMLHAAGKIDRFWQAVEREPVFGAAVAARDWKHRWLSKRCDLNLVRSYRLEYVKERFAVLRAPVRLGVDPKFPEFAAYRSPYLDQLRAAAYTRTTNTSLDPAVVALLKHPLTQSEDNEYREVNNIRARLARSICSNEGSEPMPQTEIDARRRLKQLYVSKFGANDFSSSPVKKRVLEQHAKSFAGTNEQLVFVDLSQATILSGQLNFALAIANNSQPLSGHAWQFQSKAHLEVTDIAPGFGNFSVFDTRRFDQFRLAVDCNVTFTCLFLIFCRSVSTRICKVTDPYKRVVGRNRSMVSEHDLVGLVCDLSNAIA